MNTTIKYYESQIEQLSVSLGNIKNLFAEQLAASSIDDNLNEKLDTNKIFRYQILRKMANISSNGLTNYNNEFKTKNSNFNLEKLQKYSHK